ncbi:hypothetical protein [Acidithiobacillus ferriphilus]|jgi:hypothetical protein|uniref:hypothetical protein n=1 Tax=Acidithiobacillus ferriphilus TaxID=1689834 RepID=UPI00232C2992|nr:hypothetical protein [Acidithiobacillus ferriphilus]WCE94429.1 hypothetical protein PJU76_02510 [Acidithiobacillus ferriphilus]
MNFYERPLTKAEIERKKNMIILALLIYSIFAAAISAASIYLIWGSFHPHVLSIAVSLIIWMTLEAPWVVFSKDSHDQYKPIPPNKLGEMAAFLERHPELSDYRTKVLAEPRPFIGLELKMISSYENHLQHQEHGERLYGKDWPEE